MADLDVDTTAPAYTTRRQQFADIVTFYKERLRAYHKLRDPDMRQAWRQADPFLADLLRFAREVDRLGSKGL